MEVVAPKQKVVRSARNGCDLTLRYFCKYRNMCTHFYVNGFFMTYYHSGHKTDSWMLTLVNFYSNYLCSYINLGEAAVPFIRKNSNGNWFICCRIINTLIDNNTVPIAKAKEWCALSKRMNEIMGNCQ